MQAPAQIQAVIELLDEISDRAYPADRTMANYFKHRRYIGSKDKAVISEYFYLILRNKLCFGYLLNKVGIPPNSRRLGAVLLRHLGLRTDSYFNGQGHGPKPLSESDKKAIDLIDFADLSDAPLFVQLNVPEWLQERLQHSLGDMYESEMRASNEQATTDIRVNTLKSTVKQVSHFLKKVNLCPQKTPISPWGLRFDKRVALFGTQAFKDGWIEVQDEGSQLLALVSKVKPSQKVVDFCAGAGGKTLAMAAMMQNKGTIYACDVHSKRLAQLSKRTRRAGVHNVRTHVLSSENDKWVKKHQGAADVVLIDAPCSGTGTWRRSPDSRWNLTQADLENLLDTQYSILRSAQRLVKSGGVLLYATCSLLTDENEKQVERFLSNHEAFKAMPDYFSDLDFDQSLLDVSASQLRTYPSKTGTDGFFLAALQKTPTD
ncbi:MAG: RsmB/NOP family class I SAM-dependent RNA methyltransferase [Gammaproteobacteria bacterium]|nr:RsmB/NOP family class I SAM-dependent RNA methyltransferase [Gammaproteobacteria bacterium]